MVLIQAKHTRTASSHLGTHVDLALKQLTEQEMLIDAANSRIPPEVANKDTFCTFCLVCCFKAKVKKNNSFFLCSLFACDYVAVIFPLQSSMSLTSVKEKMEAAKLELKAYSHTLTELISKIGKSAVDVGNFHRCHILVFLIYKSHASSLNLKCQITERAGWLFMPRLT